MLAESEHDEDIVYVHIGKPDARCFAAVDAEHTDRPEGVRGGAGGDPCDDAAAVRSVSRRGEGRVE